MKILILNLLKFWTSDFGKRGQNRPQNLLHEKGTRYNNNRRTLRLLDRIGPVGQLDEKNKKIGAISYLGNLGKILFKKFFFYLFSIKSNNEGTHHEHCNL